MQKVTNYTLSSLHFEKFEIVGNTISFHINLLPFYASHCLMQGCCLALEFIIFCLTIVACYVSVSFLSASYVGFGPVFFWQTPCSVHVAHCHSTHAKAFTLWLCCNHTVALIHYPSHSSIIVLTVLELAPARANAPV